MSKNTSSSSFLFTTERCECGTCVIPKKIPVPPELFSHSVSPVKQIPSPWIKCDECNESYSRDKHTECPVCFVFSTHMVTPPKIVYKRLEKLVGEHRSFTEKQSKLESDIISIVDWIDKPVYYISAPDLWIPNKQLADQVKLYVEKKYTNSGVYFITVSMSMQMFINKFDRFLFEYDEKKIDQIIESCKK